MPCRTQGRNSIHPSVCLSIHLVVHLSTPPSFLKMTWASRWLEPASRYPLPAGASLSQPLISLNHLQSSVILPLSSLSQPLGGLMDVKMAVQTGFLPRVPSEIVPYWVCTVGQKIDWDWLRWKKWYWMVRYNAVIDLLKRWISSFLE